MPKYVKGQSGNPHGRPKRPEIEELRKAIKTVEAKKRKKLLTHFVERAYESDDVLKALGKKIIPDLSSVHGDLNAKLEVFRLNLGAPDGGEGQNDKS